MRFIKQVLFALLALLGLLVVIALLLPAQVHVERSVVIDAPPGRVFPMLDDLREFNRWSPWARMDPQTHYRFSDPSSGGGAEMHWESEQPEVGSGSMRITESIPGEKVAMILDFGPKGQAEAYLSLQAQGEGSRVTWGFDEDFGYNLPGRYLGLMFDGMLGPHYEAGLHELKKILEAPAGG